MPRTSPHRLTQIDMVVADARGHLTKQIAEQLGRDRRMPRADLLVGRLRQLQTSDILIGDYGRGACAVLDQGHLTDRRALRQAGEATAAAHGRVPVDANADRAPHQEPHAIAGFALPAQDRTGRKSLLSQQSGERLQLGRLEPAREVVAPQIQLRGGLCRSRLRRKSAFTIHSNAVSRSANGVDCCPSLAMAAN